jgi:DNA-directed RNA polymerase specialized sigma24 family protein
MDEIKVIYNGGEVRVSREVADFLSCDERRREAERKRDARHLTDKPLEVMDKQGRFAAVAFEEEAVRKITCSDMLSTLTTVQKKRVTMYFECGLTCEKIAGIEGVSKNVVAKSIRQAKEKIKKF